MTLPIHNIEIEQGLIGIAIINSEAINMVSGLVDADDFFEGLHKSLWEVCVSAVADGRKIDLRLLISAIGKEASEPIYGDEKSPTVAQYLASLAKEATTIINAVDYAKAIRDLADQRKIAALGASLRRENPEDPIKLATDAIDALDAIVSRRTNSAAPVVSSAEMATAALDEAADAYQRDGAITGLSWGLKELDSKTLGLHGGELIIIGGRPGSGKTALGLSVARSLAKQRYRGLFFSLEMGHVPLGQRLLSDEMYDSLTRGISYSRLRSGKFSEGEFYQIREATKEISKYSLMIEQEASLTVAQMAARARQHKRKRGLHFMVVDHIQLAKPSERYRGKRNDEVGEVTAGLKVLSKELGIPIIALCQLSRVVESREDKRPILSDLRDSGNIEQDADLVVMLYRESYYLERQEPSEHISEAHAKWQTQMTAAHNKLEVLIEKQRQGPVGRVRVFCDIACNAIRDADYGKTGTDTFEG